MDQSIVLAGACRTATGKFGGALAGVPAAELGGIVIKAALARSAVPGGAVDQVLFGQVLQAGSGQNVARQAAVAAGLPVEVPASTLNNVCGSGLQAVNLAAALIRARQAEVVVVGGVENMSMAPYLLRQARFGYRLGAGELVDSMQSDGLTDAFSGQAMGVTAETVAARLGITRADQDAYALASQEKALAAIADGVFAPEIVPVPVTVRRDGTVFEVDEPPRATSLEALARLKPVFQEGGSVTAGNSSVIADGAAALVVMSSAKAAELGVAAQGRWLAGASAGIDPAIMGLGPVRAVKAALRNAGSGLKDVGLVELNEAFAAQALGVIRELGLDLDRVNVTGGGIALGHPLGASGARIVVTLLHAMERRDIRLGLATLCVGGGMGVAALVGASS
ncbi:MAG: acetyl-CoA C-acyltransferase [Bifidobacteriaceae bacterium]|nr:acetyl-CoA C-acyltransferase [Bifidobacteriaceae bacterium]